DRAFAREKEGRFNSAREFVEALRRGLGISSDGSGRPKSGAVTPRQFTSWKAVGGSGEAPRVAVTREDSGGYDRTSVSMKARMPSGSGSARPAQEPPARESHPQVAESTRAGDIFAHSNASLTGSTAMNASARFVRLATIGLGIFCLALAA